MNLNKLLAPFPESQVSWRIGQAGKKGNGEIWAKALVYFDARNAMNRLDEVLGPQNWQDKYRREGTATICAIGVKIGDEWVWKEDASDESDIEAVKGSVSGAFKRACVKWGVGRYLYDIKDDNFVKIVDQKTPGAIYAKTEKLGVFYWLPPSLPTWATPKKDATMDNALANAAKKAVSNPLPPSTSGPSQIVTGAKITEPQLKRLFAIQKKHGVTDDHCKEMAERLGITCSRKDMTRTQYDSLVSAVKAWKA